MEVLTLPPTVVIFKLLQPLIPLNITMNQHIEYLTSSLNSILTTAHRITMDIPLEMLQANNEQWNDSIIFTLIECDHINPNHVLKAIRKKWGVQNTIDIIRFGTNLFVYNIMWVKDKERVVEREPWTINLRPSWATF
ncbi:hypothetical protein FRX31_019262 [Thalictrum thalictroides]|uniref:DUF4283 domain-containing protein n=1 Tax=Thalictrum thalictroides TaxID=46969 RepID=A0A7J6W171_THATH|nr:hypothetical protein FRX31_019262 [Thalictrum thalictroides]